MRKKIQTSFLVTPFSGWCYAQVAAHINAHHSHPQYLKDFRLADTITSSADPKVEGHHGGEGKRDGVREEEINRWYRPPCLRKGTYAADKPVLDLHKYSLLPFSPLFLPLDCLRGRQLHIALHPCAILAAVPASNRSLRPPRCAHHIHVQGEGGREGGRKGGKEGWTGKYSSRNFPPYPLYI